MPTLDDLYWSPIVEELFDNEWLSLRVIKWPERGIDGYVYAHEKRCHGKIVAVLPFRRTPGGFQVLLRVETVPAWGMAQQPCSLTGACDHPDEPVVEVAERELAEESGYVVPAEDLISLGTCRAAKSLDTVYYLFAADVTGLVPGEASGDGSQIEQEATTTWVGDPSGCQDPLVSVMWSRLLAR